MEIACYRRLRTSLRYRNKNRSMGRSYHTVKHVVELIRELKETIAKQSGIIKSVKTELAAVKEERRYLKSQNAELQKTIGSLRAQLDIISISPPCKLSKGSRFKVILRTGQSPTHVRRTKSRSILRSLQVVTRRRFGRSPDQNQTTEDRIGKTSIHLSPSK